MKPSASGWTAPVLRCAQQAIAQRGSARLLCMTNTVNVSTRPPSQQALSMARRRSGRVGHRCGHHLFPEQYRKIPHELFGKRGTQAPYRIRRDRNRLQNHRETAPLSIGHALERERGTGHPELKNTREVVGAVGAVLDQGQSVRVSCGCLTGNYQFGVHPSVKQPLTLFLFTLLN